MRRVKSPRIEREKAEGSEGQVKQGKARVPLTVVLAWRLESGSEAGKAVVFVPFLFYVNRLHLEGVPSRPGWLCGVR